MKTIAKTALYFIAGFTLMLVAIGTSHADEAAPVGSRFILNNHNGKIVMDRDFQGSFMLVAFGYTYCPDICPTALSNMAAALDELGDRARQIVPIFISVDPERDTPARLREYVPHFHPRLVGLSGPAGMIDRVTSGYRAIYKKVPSTDGDPKNYTIDHTASIYLMAPDGKFLVKFAHAMNPGEMANRIRDFID